MISETDLGVGKPIMLPSLNGYLFEFPDLRLRISCERITDDGTSEIAIYHKNGDNKDALLHISRVNLLSTPTITQLVKRLEINAPFDWATIFTFITAMTIQEIRKGEPAVPLGKKPEIMKLEYQLAPILEKNQPTTIYGPGGSIKSYLADYIAVMVQCNVAGIADDQICWIPTAGNVLYLDWESSWRDHERRIWAIKKGMGITDQETLLYRFCSQPLINEIYAVQKLVSDNKIDLAIIDSQMAASGYGSDPAQSASQYYNALRSLHCTTLTIDHVDKSTWRGETPAVGPYGSVVKYNRSRSQFEIKKSQEAGRDFVEIALIHRKHNEGRILKPMGIRVDFINDPDDNLDSVKFSSCQVKNNPELFSKALTVKQKLIATLVIPKSVKELSLELNIAEASLRTELNRHSQDFRKVGDKWGCLDRVHNSVA